MSFLSAMRTVVIRGMKATIRANELTFGIRHGVNINEILQNLYPVYIFILTLYIAYEK